MVTVINHFRRNECPALSKDFQPKLILAKIIMYLREAFQKKPSKILDIVQKITPPPFNWDVLRLDILR